MAGGSPQDGRRLHAHRVAVLRVFCGIGLGGEQTQIALRVGAGIQRFGSLGVPVAITAIAFVIGLLVLPSAQETKGQALPA